MVIKTSGCNFLKTSSEKGKISLSIELITFSASKFDVVSENIPPPVPLIGLFISL